MKKKTIFLLVIILIIFISRIIYFSNKTERVLVSGKVFGFDITETEQRQYNRRDSLLPTSLKKIGTITFVKKDSNSFAALGHSIAEVKSQGFVSGDCYEINMEQIEKAEKDNPGRIVASLDRNQKIGQLVNANDYGVFGQIDKSSCKDLLEMETSNRYDVVIGKAYILIDLDGNGIDKYEVEIIGVNYLNQKQNIKLYIKSNELLEKTGGIVQGMSGAPIVQYGKLVGAVNFVSKEDPTEAYGIFIDKLI